jgi:putative transposase
MWQQVGLTLALTSGLPDDTLPEVVETLLTRLKQLGLHASGLSLDKGFGSGPVMGSLQPVRPSALLAGPLRGKPAGIPARGQGPRGRFTPNYPFTDGTTARLVRVDTRVPDPKSNRQQRNWRAFVLVLLDWTPRPVYRNYRRRFGIESAYRLLRQLKVLTNCRNPAWRFFRFGLGLLLQKVWVLARGWFTRRPGKGRHKLIPSLLRFARFRKLLGRAIERFHPPPLAVSVFASSQSVIH